ncbi:hypothetical protein BTUL_0159g00020 [Botrytis tulipae]|uniref:Uncharacterized protein n=1 Tax=Botrytis tulipae TaxID=87230 RepID=A0A4Z1EL01_9HELO|nr:hypothetical protein BTUL_0159g00020 [Botrytis tulipae]
MDGLSTAASVIAVVQLAQAVGGALMEYYEGVKSARDDVQRLYHSIKNLESVLESVDDLPPTLSINIQRLLENKTGTLSLCKGELDGIKKELDTFSKQQDRIGKLKSLIWPFKKKDVDKHVDFIDKHKHDLMLAFGVENLHISLHDHDILEDIRSEIRATQRDKERGQIIEWLAKSLSDPSTEHNIAREKFQEGTGSWLIDGNHFNTWLKTDNSFLWLNGGAGAGKSILCSTVVDHIQQLCKQEINVVITYWYIKFDNLTTQSVSNIIRSWIRDICSNRRDTPQTLKDAYAHCNHGQQQPTIKQLMEILKSVVAGLQDVYLVVDALDEYPKTERDLILETLKDIHQWKIDSIHIFVTSRAEDDIRFHLDEMRERDVSDSCQSIKVQDPNITEDIKKFLNENISSFRQAMWSSDFKDEVVESVARQADGMFRLAALQLDSLKRHRTVSAIRTRLNQLPSSLDIFYERALKDIPEEDQRYVTIALQWITYTAHPLKVSELSEAVIVPIDSPPYLNEDERLSCESNNSILLDIIPSALVTVYSAYSTSMPDGNSYIHLAHYSVQEFLQSSRTSNGPVKEYHIKEVDSLKSMSAQSIAYLLHAGSVLKRPYPGVIDMYERFPLIYHAALCWTYYVKRLESKSHESHSLVDYFRTPLHAVTLGLYLQEKIIIILLAAARMNRPEICKLLYKAGAELKAGRGMWDEASLHVAFEHGQVEVYKFFLDQGFDIEHRGSSDGLGTPLLVASKHGKFEVVKMLLASGADIEAEYDTYSPLQYASASHNVQICELRLDSGCDVNHKTKAIVGEYSSLHQVFYSWQGRAFENGPKEDPLPTIKLLLNYGADTYARNEPRWEVDSVVIAIVLYLECSNIMISPLNTDRFSSIVEQTLDMLLCAGAGNGQNRAELFSYLKEETAVLERRHRRE